MKESFEEMVNRYRAELMKLVPNASVPSAEPAAKEASVSGTETVLPAEPATATGRSSALPVATYPDTGFLQISLSTARQSIPLADGLVTVLQIDPKGNPILLYVLHTDSSGRAPTVSLPAPSRALSEVPGSAQPFALYDIRAERSEYIGQMIRNIRIFSGITSNIAIEMLPSLLPAGQVPDTETIFPPDNQQEEKGA